MKALKFCVNGDKRQVCPPNKVLCKECLDEISKKMERMIANFPKDEEKTE